MDSQKIRNVLRGMDKDSVLENVGDGMRSFPGAYVDGRNFHLPPGIDGMGGAARKLRGTREVPWNAPPGVNTCLGTYADETGDTLVCFIHNSNGDHCIIWMHPGEPSGRTMVIPEINLSAGNPVAGCVLVNQELLAFCDGMEGDYPKMIDLPRADRTDKAPELRLYLPQSQEIVTTREFRATVLLNGTPVGPAVGPPLFPNASPSQVRDFRPMMAHFATAWNSIPALSQYFTATASGVYVTLEAASPGDWDVQVSTTDYINGVAQPPVQCVAEVWNGYNSAWHFAQLRLSRMKPLTPPSVQMAADPSRKSNLIKKKLFQFCYSYRLRNKERTLTSPISSIPLPSSGSCVGTVASQNMIQVTFAGDKWLLNPATRSEVEVIDIHARDGNAGSWMLVASLEKWEWMYSRTFMFYNDGAYTPSDSLWVEQPSTSVPYTANALDMLRDTDDNQRIVMGGIREGDDPPPLDITLEVQLADQPPQAQTVSITGKIVIMGVFDPNPAVFGTQHYNFNQPIWVYDEAVGPVYGGFGPSISPLVELLTNDPQAWGQRIPQGGFTFYAAGTDIKAISVQTNFPATVSGGTLNAIPWSPPQGSPFTAAGSRNVYDGTQRGYSIVPTNRTHRDAIRSMIEDDHVYGTFRMDGLERGKTYVIRIASNFVDALDDGSIYDLNDPSMRWQRTSTRTLQVGSNDALVNPSGGLYPPGTVIRSGRSECVVTIPLTGPAVIDIGNSVIMDTTNPNPIDGSFVIDGYLFDSLGADYSASMDIRTRGVAAEKQLVRLLNHGLGANYDPFANPSFNILYLAPFLWPALSPTIIYNTFVQQLFGLGTSNPGDYRTYSDHNGYWWFFNKNQPSHSPQAQWCGVTGDPGNPSGVVTAINNPSGTQFYQILNDYNSSKWEGGPNGALEGALNPVAGDLFNGPGWRQYIFANLVSTTSHRTHILARVLTLSGAAVQGVTAIMQNGGTAISDQSGFINLVVFGDVIENLNRRFVDDLVLLNNTPCIIDFNGSNQRVVHITQFVSGGQFSESPDNNWFRLYDLVPITLNVIPQPPTCFSRGGTYSIAAAPVRWDGSGPAPVEIGVVRVPNLGDDLTVFDPIQWPPSLYPGGLWSSGVASIKVTIAGTPPVPWIGRFENLQLFATADGTRDFQLQWVAGEVTYATAWDETGSAPVPTSFASGNASEVYIALGDSLSRYKEINTDSIVGYTWEDGDILRVLSGPGGGQALSVMEYSVTGRRGVWVVLKADSSMPEITAGALFEIFRPAPAAQDGGKVYYALPEGVIGITDPYGSPSWSLGTLTLSSGDTYLLPTRVPFQAISQPGQPWGSRTMTRESKSASDFFDSKSWSRGKAAFTDPDGQEEERGALMRYSNGYKPGTSINGLNIFDGLNFRIVENFLGPIRRLVRYHNVILGICENGSFAVYAGIDQAQVTEDAVLETAGGVLGTVRPFSDLYGTTDPLSVVVGANHVMWLDRKRSAVVRYASNALQDMAMDGRVSSAVLDKCLWMPADGPVVAGWDGAYKEFIFSFPAYIKDDGTVQVEVPDEGLAFHSGDGVWVSWRDFSPDAWGRTANRLWSFRGGRLWLHNDTGDHNNVYGSDVLFSVDIPFVDDQFTLKHPKVLWVSRGPGWSVPLVYTFDGQESSIPDADIVTRVGNVSKGQVYNNVNTPASPLTLPALVNGDPLTSTAFVVRVTNPGNGQCLLVNATLSWQEVPDTQ